MLKKTGVAFLLLSTWLLVACGNKSNNVRFEPFQEPVQPLPYPQDQGVKEITRLWQDSVSVDKDNTYSRLIPAIYDNRVIVPSNKGDVVAFDLNTGKELWDTDLKQAIFAGVSVNNGLLALALENGVIVLLNADNGKTIWRQPAGRQIAASPVIGDQHVIVRTVDGLLLGLSIKSGEMIWQQQLKVEDIAVHAMPQPVVVNNVVLVGMADGVLAAMNVQNGSMYWVTQINNQSQQGVQLADITAPPLLAGNLVIASTFGEELAAYRLQSSEQVWKLPISTYQPMHINAEFLFLTDELGGISTINTINGQLIWQQNAFRGRGVSHPVTVGNRVVVGDNKGRLHLLDMVTGSVKQSAEISKGAIRHIIVDSQRLIVFTAHGELLAFQWGKRTAKADDVQVREVNLESVPAATDAVQ